MARIRSIKPGLYTNEELAECSIPARFLFTGLWVIADREGRLRDRPRKIKLETFPFDDIDVDPLLNELQAAGFIHRYKSGNDGYIQIHNFAKHQRPHPKEPASEIPEPQGFTRQETPKEEHEEEQEIASREEKFPKISGHGEKFSDTHLPGRNGDGNGSFKGNGNGDGGKADAAARASPPSVLSKPQGELATSLARACKRDLAASRESTLEKINSAVAALRIVANRPDELIAARLRRFGEFFETLNYKDKTPNPSQVPEFWQRYESWLSAQESRQAKTESKPVDSALSGSLEKMRRKQEKAS